MKIILWLFLIYSFLGWCTEVMHFAFEKGEFVNRGYLPDIRLRRFGLAFYA